MGRCVLVLYTLALASCLFCVHSFPKRDGSEWTSQRCECETVEFWLPKRTNGPSNQFSYEEVVYRTQNNKLSSNTLRRNVRVWVPKQCEILLDSADILQENLGFHGRNIADRSVEIWFTDSSRNCVAVSLKCKLRTLCAGIDTRMLGVVQSPKRKLLTYKTEGSEEVFSNRPYGVLFSVLLFCSMAILIALCGKTEKNSQDSVAHDDNAGGITIVSSEKLKSPPRQSGVSNTEKNSEEEVIDVKVEGSNDLTDGNSNDAAQPPGDVDLSSVVVSEDVPKNNGETRVDGAVFAKDRRGQSVNSSERENEEERGAGEKQSSLRKKRSESENEEKKEKRKEEKEKEKEDKRKEKEEKRKGKEREREIKNKERNKEMRSRRSHTVPSESTETKVLPKMRLSLKSDPNTGDDSDDRKTKKDKKKSKKKSEADSPPESSTPPPFAGDRHSFVHRELPKRPSDDYEECTTPTTPPPTTPPPTTSPPVNDLETDEDNYELVVDQKRRSGDVKRLRVPSANLSDHRGSRNDDNDSSLYDSVDETKIVVKSTASFAPVRDTTAEDESDTYETVETKVSLRTAKASSNTPATELYESVGGEYDEPTIRRQRSFSDINPGPSAPVTTNAERKAKSLGRERTPTPPPLEHMKLAVQSRHQIIEDIEPYTMTFKKGDRIIQEANIVKEPPLSSGPREERNLSPEELEMLYTKVDKAKQMKDRMECDLATEKDDGDNEERKEARGGEAAAVSVQVGVEEHQYETMPRKKEAVHETEDFTLYEEVVTKDE